MFMGANDNEDTSFHNLWDTGKAVIRGKFIAISAHKRSMKRRQMDHLTSCLTELEKQQQKDPKKLQEKGNNKDTSRNK